MVIHAQGVQDSICRDTRSRVLLKCSQSFLCYEAERRESVAVGWSQVSPVKGFCCVTQVCFNLIDGSSDW